MLKKPLHRGSLLVVLAAGILTSTRELAARELGLAEAIELGVKNSHQRRQAEAELNAQRARSTAAWLALGPRLSASYKEAHFGDKVGMTMPGPAGPIEILVRNDISRTGSLTLVQPLSGLYALAELARHEGKKEELSRGGAAAAAQAMAFRTAALFLQAQQAVAMWGVAKSSIEAVASQRKDGEAMLNAGRINRGDFLKLELAVSEAQARAAKARAAQSISLFTLQEVTGLAHESSLTLPALSGPDKLEAVGEAQLDQASALKRAEEQRIELRQAQLGREIAGFGHKLVYAKHAPSLNLFARLDHNFGKVGLGAEKDTQSFGVDLSWEIWSNGTSFYEMEEASEALHKAEAGIAAVQQQVRLEVVSAWANLVADREAWALARAALEQADEAYRIEKVRFVSGKSTATELVLSETARSSAAINLVAAYTLLRLHKMDLEQAMGQARPALEKGATA